MAVCVFSFPPAQDPAGSRHKRFLATEAAHRPEDAPEPVLMWKSEESKKRPETLV